MGGSYTDNSNMSLGQQKACKLLQIFFSALDEAVGKPGATFLAHRADVTSGDLATAFMQVV